MLKAGDYVVHSMEGVCEVKSIVEMPKGRERVSYYQLSSWPEKFRSWESAWAIRCLAMSAEQGCRKENGQCTAR